MKRFLILGLCFIIIYGCEHGGDFVYKVDNKSDYNFEVMFKVWDMGGDSVHKTLDISPKTDLSIYKVQTINHGCSDFDDLFLMWYDTISLSIKNDTMILNKDFRLRKNWQFSSDCKNFGAESEYLFVIENRDIVRKTK